MELFWYNPIDDTLYINTDAITPRSLSYKERGMYLKKPIQERIAESPYVDKINAEIARHPGCRVSEFSTPVGCPI